MQNQIQLFIDQNAVDQDIAKSLEPIYSPLFQQVKEKEKEAQELVVTSVDDKEKIARARELRLFFRDIRTATEKKRKEMKEESLRKGQAIDGMANIIKKFIEPLEVHLQTQENFAAIQAEREKAEKLASRMASLAGIMPDLAPEEAAAAHKVAESLPDAEFDEFRQSLELEVANRKAAEELAWRQAEEAAAAERERIRRIEEENAALREEARRKEEQRQRELAEERARTAEEFRLKQERERAEQAQRMREQEVRGWISLIADQDGRTLIEQADWLFVEAVQVELELAGISRDNAAGYSLRIEPGKLVINKKVTIERHFKTVYLGTLGVTNTAQTGEGQISSPTHD